MCSILPSFITTAYFIVIVRYFIQLNAIKSPDISGPQHYMYVARHYICLYILHVRGSSSDLSLSPSSMHRHQCNAITWKPTWISQWMICTSLNHNIHDQNIIFLISIKILMFNRLGVKDISFSPQCLGLGAPENVINTNQSTFTHTQKLGLRPAESVIITNPLTFKHFTKRNYCMFHKSKSKSYSTGCSSLFLSKDWGAGVDRKLPQARVDLETWHGHQGDRRLYG